MDRKMPAVLVACLLSVLVVLCARAQAVPVPPYATTAHDTQLELTELAEEERDYARLLFYRLLSATLLTSVILLALFIRSKRHQVRLKIQKMQADLARRQAEAALSREQEARRRQELEAAQRKLEYYRSLNAITIPILCGRRNEQGALHLGDDDWEAVTRNTDACFDRFTERLRAHCPLLTEEEVRFCCLVKMELPLAVLADVYHIAKGSISRRKMRLKEKLGVADGSFDEFIAGF